MKKLSLILASALLLGGISFAQTAAPAVKAAPAAKTTAPVKKDDGKKKVVHTGGPKKHKIVKKTPAAK